MEEQISLYLDLEPGAIADLDIVARASLAFSSAVKDLAFVIDPSIEISLKLASGSKGSLSLNTIIKSITDRTADRKTLSAIALVVLGWFGNDLRQYVMTQAFDAIFKQEKNLSDEEIQKISEIVARAINSKVAQQHVSQIYREIERDPAIKGVGATQIQGQRPQTIISRAEFINHLPDETVQVVEGTRTRERTETVTLISPVLLPGARRWKFTFHEGEFGASIKDESFLNDVLSGKHPIMMRSGITMTVVLQTKEEKEDEVWVVKERNILHVIDTTPVPTQQSLDLPRKAIEPDSDSEQND